MVRNILTSCSTCPTSPLVTATAPPVFCPFRLQVDTIYKGARSEACNIILNTGPEHGWAHKRSYYLCYVVCKCGHVVSNILKLDSWSLPLLWHLSDVSAVCNFWPQLQILGEGVSWPLIPALPSPCWFAIKRGIYVFTQTRASPTSYFRFFFIMYIVCIHCANKLA